MTASAPPSLHLRGARLAYGDRRLFDGLELTLEAGRTTCLLGPSGVGKSSLLRLIAGLDADAEGEVSDAEGRALQGRFSYMAQQDLLLPWLTGNDRARALALLDRVGLAEAAAQRPAALSGGMRQRVALARTLFEDRPLVLMDEPFSALDAITRFQLQDLAAELLAERSVLLVTHDPLEALRLGHRILILSGRPARLSEAEVPPGPPPRAPNDQALMRLQADLLTRLAQAKEASA